MAGPNVNTIAGANILTIAKPDAPMAKLLSIDFHARFHKMENDIPYVTTALKTGPIHRLVFYTFKHTLLGKKRDCMDLQVDSYLKHPTGLKCCV